jgi:hypothetical protein
MTLTASRVVLLIGVLMVLLAAFGVQPLASADLFMLGVGVCFASFLVP